MKPGWVCIFCSCCAFKPRVVITSPSTSGSAESGCWLSYHGRAEARRCCLVLGESAGPAPCRARHPLVEGVNIPDGTLGEDGVLVERHELAERCRCELLGEEGVRRAVALEQGV